MITEIQKSVSILSLLYCMFATSNAFAAGGTIGVKAGIGAAWLTGDGWQAGLDANDEENGPVVNLAAGAFLDLQLLHSGPFSLGLQPELLYDRLGGEGADGEANTYIYHNLEFPVYLKPAFYTPLGSLFLLAGADLLLIIGDTYGNTHDGGTIGVQSPDIRFNAGIGIGIGHDFRVGRAVIELAVTYAPFFVDLYHHIEVHPNRARVEIGAGYAFGGM